MIKLIARTCRHVLGVRLSSGAGSHPFSSPSTVIELDAARGMEIFPPASECPICLAAYEWDTRTQQPVALACGHSYCRACLCRLTSKRCPTCGKAFPGHVMTMAPNYALGDMMAAMTEFEAFMEQQAQAISVQQASGQLPAPTPPAAHTGDNQLPDGHPSQAQVAQNPIHAAAAVWPGVLRPCVDAATQTQEITAPVLVPEIQPTQQLPPRPAGSNPPRLQAVHAPQPRQVVRVASSCMISLQVLINAATVPTTYNLGGKKFCCKEGAGLCIRRDDLKLTNGTFVARQASPTGKACLNIMGSGIELENIDINFVSGGVAVGIGGQLMMRDCRLSGKGMGITVTNNAAGTCLSAYNVSVQGCKSGMEFQHCAAQLFDCTFQGTEEAIGVHGESRVAVTDTSFAQCSFGLVVTNGAHAEMVRCTWKDSMAACVIVQDPGSMVSMVSCSLDMPADSYEGGKVVVQNSGSAGV